MPAGGLIIADNDINYVSAGITAIQSSPYIARNTITGLTQTGSGLYLDNSSGTIEYNTISNFNISIVSYYSSPYLLKNTLSNASEVNLGLKSYSTPLMLPVVSSQTLRWLGGNNVITGYPSDAGINNTKDAYPVLDSGNQIYWQ